MQNGNEFPKIRTTIRAVNPVKNREEVMILQ
jgi:hypothetical protein